MTDLAARSHRLRAALSEEMHVRRLPVVASPCRLMQLVMLLGDGAAVATRAHIVALAAEHGATVPGEARYATFAVGDIVMVWEGHTEFATYTFIRPGAFAVAFDTDAFAAVAGIVAELPGEVIRATQIAITADAGEDQAALERLFAATGLVVADVAAGRARIMSDFTLHAEGYGRLLVADRGLDGNEAAQVVVRLQELGNYRNMALLGLPTAQQLSPELTRLEQRLADLSHRISAGTDRDDILLDELTAISTELARLAAATRYRMSATRAYGELALERLRSLGAAAVRGYQTLDDFTERRLVPALRTCASFSERIDDLSQRASWTSDLLRTRIDIALARQNRDLLASMDRRTGVQVRLQQAVEGLSVVAIGYYAVALIGYVAGAVPGVDHRLVMAAAVPIVLLAAGFFIHRVRRGLGE